MVITSPHGSFARTLDLKTRGCGFDSQAGQPNNYLLSDVTLNLGFCVTLLYTEHVKEPEGALSSFVLYPCAIPRNN